MKNNTFIVSVSPHIKNRDNVKTVMIDVIIALIPAVIISILYFRIYALTTIIYTVCFCFLTEWFYISFIKKEKFINDFSAVVTGLLLAMNLPPSSPVWLIFIGSLIAIILGKQIFGGLGQNPFNPALISRVILLISWPSYMTTWIAPAKIKDIALNFDATTSASPLSVLAEKGTAFLKTCTPGNMLYNDLFFGNVNGSIGETSAMALILGGMFLIHRKRITYHIPFFYILTTAILTGIFWLINPESYADPLFHILSGGLILGAFFMATDMVTSPITNKGMIIFGIGCGILTVAIRLFGAYPEGVSFSIITMNAIVPLIDKFTRTKQFGLKKK